MGSDGFEFAFRWEPAQTMVPGQSIIARMQTLLVAGVVPASHHLAIALDQAWPGPNLEVAVIAPVTWIVGDQKSQIVLDNIRPRPGSFFRAPVAVDPRLGAG